MPQRPQPLLLFPIRPQGIPHGDALGKWTDGPQNWESACFSLDLFSPASHSLWGQHIIYLKQEFHQH